MRFTPLLVLVSGEARIAEQHDSPLAFTTTTRGLQFTSCSGLLLAKGDSNHGIVLMPAAVLRHWMKPSAGWLTSSCGVEPPDLTSDCAICAVGASTALSGGAATCIPIATVRIPAVSRAAAHLLQSLNRDASLRNWSFEWHISGPYYTAAEQGSFVLCWAQPLSGDGLGTAAAAGLAPSSAPLRTLAGHRPNPEATVTTVGTVAAAATAATAAAAAANCAGSPAPGGNTSPAGGQLQPAHPRDATLCNNGSGAATAGLGPLSNPTCVALLRSLYASLSATPPSPRLPISVLSPQQRAAFAACAALSSSSSAPECGPPAACTTGVAPGRLVSVTGSPFGCLAPFHFSNAIINGAVSCAFPAPLDTPTAAVRQGTVTTVSATTAAATGRCGCGLGPALYALDAHVFPGMEGAPVTLLQQQQQQQQQQLAAPRVPGTAAGGSSDSIAPLPEPPLALLCTPVSRRADGVQVPLAAAWSHISAALKDVLAQLLLRTMGPLAVDGGMGALMANLNATTDIAEAEKQQLQLQPVATSSILRDAAAASTGGCGGWRTVRSGCGYSGGSSGDGRGGGGGRAQPFSGLPWREAGGSGCWSEGGGAVLGDMAAVGCNAAAAAAAAGPCVGAGAAAAAAGPTVADTSCCSGAVTRAVAAGSPAAATSYPPACGHCPALAISNSAAAAAGAAPTQPAPPAPALTAAGGELPPWVLQAVVLLRCNGSWATGVVVESGSGLLITTAHLFQRPPSVGTAGAPNQPHGKTGAGGGAASSGGGDAWAHLQCWARVSWVNCTGSGDGGICRCGDAARGGSSATRNPSRAGLAYRWMRARVLYMWSNHLDLAVLQLEPSYGSSWAPQEAAATAAALAAVRETAHARDDSELEARVLRCISASVVAAEVAGVEASGMGDGGSSVAITGVEPRGMYGPGSPVWAVGHSLVGPAAEWPALVSYGCIARVLRVPSGRPTMIIATTTTHAGGSGGALLDARGRLVGLVTSNARHAGSTTLPNMAFCIAAEELEPVIRWAAARSGQQQQGRSDAQIADAAKPTHAAVPIARAARDSMLSSAPSPPGHGLAALEALNGDDSDAARIWRLQMPSLEPVLAPVGLSAAAGGPEPSQAAAPAATTAAAGTGGGGGWKAAAVHPSPGVWSRL